MDNTPSKMDELLAITLFEDAVANGQTDATALASSIAQFPECAELLREQALISGLYAQMPESDEITRIRETIENRAARLNTARFARIAGIIAEGKIKGFAVTELSKRLGLGKTLIIKLDRRLIDAATIPHRLIELLADTLQTSIGSIRAYLSSPPTLAQGASFRSKQSAAPKQESFESALATSVQTGEITQAEATLWQRS
jgi:hypothetical protein